MIRICAWCRKPLDDGSDSAAEAASGITHGICLSCADEICLRLGKPLAIFLETIPAPVVVVDQDMVVKAANKKARKILGKELPRIEGFSGGKIFECIYCKLPGGCGQTTHCNGCTIRRAVAETHASGKALVRIRAYLTCQPGKGSRNKIVFLISTEKVGKLVFLRIDEVGKGRKARLGLQHPRSAGRK